MESSQLPTAPRQPRTSWLHRLLLLAFSLATFGLITVLQLGISPRRSTAMDDAGQRAASILQPAPLLPRALTFAASAAPDAVVADKSSNLPPLLPPPLPSQNLSVPGSPPPPPPTLPPPKAVSPSPLPVESLVDAISLDDGNSSNADDADDDFENDGIGDLAADEGVNATLAPVVSECLLNGGAIWSSPHRLIRTPK